MAEDPNSSKSEQRYAFRLLRYRPTNSGEFYNVAVVLEDESGAVVDARFTPDFDRFSCNPAADLELLERIRDEFEESRLLGEGFSEHLRALTASRYPLFEQASPEAFFGGDAPAEVDRLVRDYLATPAAPQSGRTASAGGRQAIRRRMDQTLERHGLIGESLVRRKAEAIYGPSLRFQFDFGYQPRAGGMRYLQAFPDRNGVAEAGRLCFVMEHLAERAGRRLTAVHSEAEVEALALLESGGVVVARLDQIEEVALHAREDLGL